MNHSNKFKKGRVWKSVYAPNPNWLRPIAAILLLVMIAGCTRTVSRAPMETRKISVKWDKLDKSRLIVNGLVVEAVPLTPAQWPLEASLKKLISLDFLGVIDRFDLSFHSSKLDSDVLRRLYDAGYLPVYMRVSNRGKQRVTFLPHLLAVEADGKTLLYPVPAMDLPTFFREIDWARTGTGVVLAALFVVVAALSMKEGQRGGLHPQVVGDMTQIGVDVASAGAAQDQARHNRLPTQREKMPAFKNGREVGFIYSERLSPGQVREGFLFFRVDATVADWTTVRLTKP